jgi:DNA replication and repair protein RecF
MLAEAQEGRRSPGAAVGRVGVTRLVLTDFRNYREARLTLGTEAVALTGPNGAGKTNLLEALSFLAPGRGLRGVKLSEIDRRQPTERDRPADGWAVSAVVETRRGTFRVGTGRDATVGERRIVRIDGEPVRGQAILGERLGLAWLTPSMDRLFTEGPSGRRRFLDRLVLGLDPAHATHVTAYEQALRERARLLRDGLAEPAWLSALEEVMAERGVAAAAGRREAVERLDRACAGAEGPFPRARLRLVGTVEEWLAAMPALAAEERLAAALVANRQNDAQTGSTSIGPHRSDLAVVLAEKGIAAELASTGEQKALLISITLAHARLQRTVRGEPPVLLLDEIAAHLDASRRAALFEALLRLDSQVWLTGTDEALFAPLRGEAQFISVREGKLAATFF